MNATRRIWLCADDYGISPGVNRGIRELIARGRINATSAMVVAPALDANEAGSLATHNAAGRRAAIGLHVTLTAPFQPLTEGFAALAGGNFLTLSNMLAMAVSRRLDGAALKREITAQLRTFVERFGRPPDFVDGHQHVQLFPQIRDAFLHAVAEAAPRAWVRQCGRAGSRRRRLNDRKGLLLDILSIGFRRKARRVGLAVNPAFAGTYSFASDANFAAVFPSFLEDLPDGALVMCHPGFVDDELVKLDPLTTLREREFDYFNGDEFPQLLASRNVTLA